ncbi:MAG: hypothetical protein ACJAYU_001424 [Bradymonadia bacterium]|jgi:hypothetical protein
MRLGDGDTQQNLTAVAKSRLPKTARSVEDAPIGIGGQQPRASRLLRNAE